MLKKEKEVEDEEGKVEEEKEEKNILALELRGQRVL